LQEKMENARRELARLNEQKPANELKQAADKLEEAKNQLEQGGNAGQAQKDAAKDVNQAKDDLKQAQEELARELLVKMADQLDGLQKRQVALVERSEKFQDKLMKVKLWTEFSLETIDGNIDAQKNVAEETENLKEKIKEAKVFHSILGKAKDAMDSAGETMSARRAEGAMRQVDRMD